MINGELKRLRTENHAPLYSVCRKSGLKQSYIQAVECGARNPSVKMLYWYCVLFNADPDELLKNKVAPPKTPYKQICVNGKEIREHRKVMMDMIGRELNPGEVVHHKNGNRRDNRLENLTIMTAGDHAKLHCQALIARRRPVEQYDLNGNYIKTWQCAYLLKAYGIDESNVAKVCNGKCKTAYGYVWKYAK